MKTHQIRNLLLASILGLSSLTAFAQSDASQASGNSSLGLSLAAGSVVAGTASLLVDGAELSVEAVEKVGDGFVLVLKGASQATTVSVKVAASTVGAMSIIAGTSIRVVAEASGNVLYTAGKVVAFIPNEVGKSLIHHSRINQGT